MYSCNNGYRTVGFEDSENLVTCRNKTLASQFKKLYTHPHSFPEGVNNLHTSNNLDLSDTVRISQDDTDLGWSSTLLGKLADLVNDLLWGGLEP